MKHAAAFTRSLAAVAVAFAAACTMQEQEPPAITGPSEFGQSITITITPDVIQQDGASQSVVAVTARGPNGQPLANVPLRADIRVQGTPTDFGSISARNLVTDAQGRASLVYTAPPALTGIAVDEFTVVDIGITPVGNNFGNSVTRTASLRLVPTGIVAPPDGLRPAFTFTPEAPTDNQNVLFDASTSTAPNNNPIARFDWDFGDGQRASGRMVTHAYDEPGTYTVTLTIVDALGRARSTAQNINVGAGQSPTARFTSSPSQARAGQTVNLNAVTSTPAPGRRLVRYQWDFGDGTSGSGQQTTHVYSRAGDYVVTLTVTDDVGRTASVAQTVTVMP